jgi:hypothetical protein
MKKEFKNKDAGKGSRRRKEDFRKVQENWDLIDWGQKKEIESSSKHETE